MAWLIILALIAMPFFVLGVKRFWLFALIFWVVVSAYAVFLLQQPLEEMGQEVWKYLVLATLLASALGFAGGFLLSGRKTYDGIDLKDTFE